MERAATLPSRPDGPGSALFADTCRSFDGAAWTAHSSLRDEFGAGELAAMIRAEILPPLLSESWVARQDARRLEDLLASLDDGPHGERLTETRVRSVVEKLLVGAADSETAARLIAAVPSRHLTAEILRLLRHRWGADPVVWEACVRRASEDIDALEQLWTLNLPRPLLEQSLRLWSEQVAAKISQLAACDDSAQRRELGDWLTAALGTTVSDPTKSGAAAAGRLEVQAQLLRARDRIPAAVWLHAIADLTEDLTGQLPAADPGDWTDEPSGWSVLGAQLRRNATGDGVRSEVDRIWGANARILAGTETPLARQLTQLRHTRDTSRGTVQLIADIAAIATPELLCERIEQSALPEGTAPAPLPVAVALGARAVQKLALGDAGPDVWTRACTALVRATGSLAGVPTGQLGRAGLQVVWDAHEKLGRAAAWDRSGAPEPDRPELIHTQSLSSRLMFAVDDAELLYRTLQQRVGPDADEAYQLAISLLPDYDGTLQGLCDLAADTLS